MEGETKDASVSLRKLEEVSLPQGTTLKVRVAEEAQSGKTAYAVWHATKIAIEYVMANPSLFEDKKILDLGCGTGFLGMAIASICPSCTVYVSDLKEYEGHVKENLAINGFKQKNEFDDEFGVPGVYYRPFDITSPTFVREIRKSTVQFDVIFASEIFHDPEVMQCLLKALPELTAPQNTTLYALHMRRNFEVSEQWLSGLEKAMLEVTHLDPNAHKHPMNKDVDHYRPQLFFQKIVHPVHTFVAAVVENDVDTLRKMIKTWGKPILEVTVMRTQTCKAFWMMTVQYPDRPMSPVLVAADSDAFESLQFLLEQGANPLFTDEQTGCNVLDYAMLNLNQDAVSFYMLKGLDVAFERCYSFEPDVKHVFHSACIYADSSIVKLMLIRFASKLTSETFEECLKLIALRSHDRDGELRLAVIKFLKEDVAQYLSPTHDRFIHQGKQEHVMISYCWAQQEQVRQLKRVLDDNHIKTWYDEQEMKGNIIDCMAYAMENAHTVLACVSEGYQNSQNCKAEAMYARELKKKVIFIKMDKGFNARSWLGFVMGAQLYYNIDDWQIPVLPMLMDSTEINKTTSPSTAATAAVPSIQDWNAAKVQEWLSKEVPGAPAGKFEGFNGKCLLQLSDYLKKDLKEFRLILRETLQITQLSVELEFAFALLKL
eukprot:gb/GEZN01002766.1/.p1 GENE.gb/GEZN01002766.1/~~gb/GEZN01002766.1/.p1  ORF type:complete len:657 (+),score=83.15 gb/GEZN01002766.1/:63-2033(+)